MSWTLYKDLILDTLKNKAALATDANGKVIDGTTLSDARWLKLDQTTPQTTVGTFTFPLVSSGGYSITGGTHTAGKFLRCDGTNAKLSTLILPDSITASRIPYATSTNTLGDNAAFTFTTATGLLNTTGLTASGTVQAEHLKTTDDLEVADDILLASGSAFNWNSGDITLTHSADTLTFAGMTTLNLGGSVCTTTKNSTSGSGQGSLFYGAVNHSGSGSDGSFDVSTGTMSVTDTYAVDGMGMSPISINNYALQNSAVANAAHTITYEEGDLTEANYGLKNTVFRNNASITANPITIYNYGMANVVGNYTRYNNAGGSINVTNYGGHFSVTSAPTLTAGAMNTTSYGFYAIVIGTTTGTSTGYGAYISCSGNDTNYGFYNASASASLAHNFLGNDNIKTIMGNSSDLSFYHDATNSYIDNITGKLILKSPSIVEIGTGAAGVDYILQFNGETNDGVLTWMEDEDYFKFSDDIFMNDAENIILGTTTGTKIGTGTTQKLAFWNATPVVQQAHIADASGGATVDTEARAAIASINALLATLGLTAAS